MTILTMPRPRGSVGPWCAQAYALGISASIGVWIAVIWAAERVLR